MSLLNPGGYRGPVFYSGKVDNRVFTHGAVERVCNRALKDRDHRWIARTSIATGNRHIRRISLTDDCAPHEHKREIIRRRRQQTRRAA